MTLRVEHHAGRKHLPIVTLHRAAQVDSHSRIAGEIMGGVGQSLEPDAPLFVSSQRRRLSPRAAQWRFACWQRRAGFDRHYGFHQLRQSAVTNVYRASRDLFLAQRFARHASPLTTVVYTHPSDEEMFSRLRNPPC